MFFNIHPEKSDKTSAEKLFDSFQDFFDKKNTEAIKETLENKKLQDGLACIMHDPKFQEMATTTILNNIANDSEFSIYIKNEFDIQINAQSEAFQQNLERSIINIISNCHKDSFAICDAFKKINRIIKNFHPNIDIKKSVELKEKITEFIKYGFHFHFENEIRELLSSLNIPDTFLKTENMLKAKQEGDNLYNISHGNST